MLHKLKENILNCYIEKNKFNKNSIILQIKRCVSNCIFLKYVTNVQLIKLKMNRPSYSLMILAFNLAGI